MFSDHGFLKMECKPAKKWTSPPVNGYGLATAGWHRPVRRDAGRRFAHEAGAQAIALDIGGRKRRVAQGPWGGTLREPGVPRGERRRAGRRSDSLTAGRGMLYDTGLRPVPEPLRKRKRYG